jgi:hypothetical protein
VSGGAAPERDDDSFFLSERNNLALCFCVANEVSDVVVSTRGVLGSSLAILQAL